MTEDSIMARIRETRREMWKRSGEDLETYLSRIRETEERIRSEEGAARFRKSERSVEKS